MSKTRSLLSGSIFLWILTAWISFAKLTAAQQIVPVHVNANLSVTYRAEITYSMPMVYVYSDTAGIGAIRITVTSFNATEADPILILVKRQRSVLTWQVPLVLEDKFQYHTVSRIVCPMDVVSLVTANEHQDPRFRLATGEEFSVEIITLSIKPISFTMQTVFYDEFEQIGSTSFLLHSSPAAPQYVKYTMREKADRVLIKFRADPETGGNLCSTLSIQSARCPVGDLETRLRLDGRFQTVTTQGAIEVSREQFSDGYFYIAVLVKPHDGDCEDRREMFAILKHQSDRPFNESLAAKHRVKTVNITVLDSHEMEKDFVIGISVPLGVFLGFFLVAIISMQSSASEWIAILTMDLENINLPSDDTRLGFALLFEKSIHGLRIPSKWNPVNYRNCRTQHGRKHKYPTGYYARNALPTVTIVVPSDEKTTELATPLNTTDDTTTADPEVTVLQTDGENEARREEPTGNETTDAENTERDSRRRRRRHRMREHHRIRMAEICHVTASNLHQTSRDYSFSLLSLSLFYSLPVWQLVMSHQGLLLVTGNEDLCYYNFSCANRLGTLSDFNHVLSNVGYVVLGILFLLMVRRRQAFTEKLRQAVQHIDDYGTPSQLGVLYCMGLALVMEGVMSACYHICPSHDNFQFDTSFMYLITGLVILKLYHSRHPDVLPKSYVAYLMFALFIAVALIGVISQSMIYWIIFSVIHALYSVLVGLQIYFVGYLELSTEKLIRTVVELKCSEFQCSEFQWTRLILPCSVTAINLTFAIVGPILQPFDFATHLLFILQANLMLYAAFYAAMKIVKSDERISRAACLYLALAMPAWIAGMFYFTRGLSNWELSAAGSREGNRECFVLNFYDEHDVWHMLSAFGLFFIFMMLFSLDDDLSTVSRDKIPVF